MFERKGADDEAVGRSVHGVAVRHPHALLGGLVADGQASLRMEQALWPEEYARMTREVEEALREADDPNAKSYTHEEVMQAMQERIDRARDKAMLIG